jgi:hypothetical protein
MLERGADDGLLFLWEWAQQWPNVGAGQLSTLQP